MSELLSDSDERSDEGVRGKLKGVLQMNDEEDDIVDQIEQCWEEIGLSDDGVQERLSLFQDAFHKSTLSVLTYGLTSQLDYKKQLQDSVDKSKKERTELEYRLGSSSVDGVDHEAVSHMKLFDLEKYYREAYLQPLWTLKEGRKKMLDRLMSENDQYVASLGVESFQIRDPALRYRLDFLDRLAAVNHGHATTFHDRTSVMAARREHVKKLARNLKVDISHINLAEITTVNMDRTEAFEKEMVEKMENDETYGRSLLERVKYFSKRMDLPTAVSTENPDITEHLFDPEVIQKLDQELSRLETEMATHIEIIIKKHRERIRELWDILMLPTSDRHFAEILSTEFSDAALTAHENERNRLEDFYDDHREIFDLLGQRKEHLHNKQQLEEKETDPVVMQNRGGILLKTQGEKKKVVKLLEKGLTELRAAIKKKEDSSGKPFLIGGATLDDFLTNEKMVLETEKHSRLHNASATGKRKDGKGTPLAKRMKAENGTASATKTASSRREQEKLKNSNNLNRGLDGIRRELTFSSSSGKAVTSKRQVGNR